MRTLKDLKQTARVAASAHGHWITPFAKLSLKQHVAVCKRCQKKVLLDAEKSEISGEAVETTCQ